MMGFHETPEVDASGLGLAFAAATIFSCRCFSFAKHAALRLTSRAQIAGTRTQPLTSPRFTGQHTANGDAVSTAPARRLDPARFCTLAYRFRRPFLCFFHLFFHQPTLHPPTPLLNHSLFRSLCPFQLSRLPKVILTLVSAKAVRQDGNRLDPESREDERNNR